MSKSSGCASDKLQCWLDQPSTLLFHSSPSTGADSAALPIQPLYQEALHRSYGHSQLLPIESLKLDAAYWLKRIETAGGPVRTFLSSGTTGSERSLSAFGPEGLSLYRSFSLRAFWAVLQHFFPEPHAVLGWSLIPSPQQWPESSLAQMVAWIGEEGRLIYKNSDLNPPSEPVWVFATAFHLVQFADSGRRCPLPHGSVVIETGGTKGQSRAVTRAELYSLISTCFDVPLNRIISEYGMCELASQAYDFVLDSNAVDLGLEQRFYRFPHWVRLQVIDGLGVSKSTGRGTLLIDDPLRVDLPWPLRTEDIAHLQPDGRFQLLGRVPFTPLKGCSLLAEDWQPLQLPTARVLEAESWSCPDQENLLSRALVVSAALQRLWQSDLHHQCLREELGSDRLAQLMREDFQGSAPLHPLAWVAAAQHAVDSATPGRWLIIPPSTHPIAGLYPLALAAVLGLQVTLRCSSGESLLRLWQQELENLFDLKLLPASYRLGATQDPAVDALMVFGSHSTLAELRKLSPWPIKGFGSHLTGSIVHSSNLEASTALIWKDALSLGQRGCMSSRILFIWGNHDELQNPQTFARHLEAAAQTFADTLSLPASLSLVHASYLWQRQGRQPRPRTHSQQPLLLMEAWDPQRQLQSMLCDRPWALPVLCVAPGDEAAFCQWLNYQSDLQKISLCLRSRQSLTGYPQTLCNLGAANAPLWDGFHQGQALFAMNTPS